MRQGLSAIIFLLFIVLFGPIAQASEMTQSEVSSWLNNPSAQSSADHIYQLALQDKVPDIQDSLESIPLPKQEAVRYLLLKKIEDANLVLTPRMAIFIQSQQTHQPVYQFTESGDGYSVTLPAFNASLVATRLINDWKQDQTTIDFIIDAENNQLQLANWLQGDTYDVQQKEMLFLKEADSLSLQALQYLSNQLVGNSVVNWLPSTSVVIKLAQLTDDEQLYSLLWKMKADDHTTQELQRLAQVGDEFALQQIMNATQNPTIKSMAINQLVAIKPMTEQVHAFLVEKLNHTRDGLMVAQALSSTEHHDWLISLLQSGQVEQSQILLNALAVAE
ncbi:hypothetical protein ACGRL8_12530 [Vibrio rumoiensis]|uniref:hypothetical protein n=1 Tax=Vibrio rumoiensis TaxID=76258 RepID=UPI00374A3F11